MRRVVGLFQDSAQAAAVENDLVQEGIPANAIRVSDKTGQQREKGFWERIEEFFGEEDWDAYGKASQRGGTLVIADVDESRAETVIRVMNRHNPVDLQRHAEEGRQAKSPAKTEQAGSQEKQTIPVTEERVRIGKRWEEHGGVRVYTEVEEIPVSEEVSLKEEKVHVERRPADRPAQPGDFQERTIEATEGHEEAVVSKEARVVEEVVLSKEAEQRTEKVEDTVRRTKVRVEDLEEDFRKDYQEHFAGSGYTFDQIRAAYDYGRDLADDDRYRSRDWDAIEPEARRTFEQRNPGKWEKFGSAVHSGYDQTRRRVGAR